VAPGSLIAEEVKGELTREVISLEAFPPAEAAESDSEAPKGDQEGEAQLEYDESDRFCRQGSGSCTGRTNRSASTARTKTATGSYIK
jgi:hypothetical protein